ncbi:1355_t:CDS:2, partial [Acaulospora morrowiae]
SGNMAPLEWFQQSVNILWQQNVFGDLLIFVVTGLDPGNMALSEWF